MNDDNTKLGALIGLVLILIVGSSIAAVRRLWGKDDVQGGSTSSEGTGDSLELLSPTPGFNPDTARVMLFGDSQSAFPGGLGPKLMEHFNALGVDRDRTKVIADNGYGFERFLSRSGKENIETSIRDWKPTLVIVQLGGNDAARNPARGAYESKIRGFLDTAFAEDVEQVIWLGPSFVLNTQMVENFGEGFSKYQQARQRIADIQSGAIAAAHDDGQNAHWLDQMDNTRHLPKTDGVHHSSANTKAWADTAWAETLPLLGH